MKNGSSFFHVPKLKIVGSKSYLEENQVQEEGNRIIWERDKYPAVRTSLILLKLVHKSSTQVLLFFCLR
jgi:hypothetical protein